MKRTVILLLTMAAAAVAQTPTVVEKPAAKPSTTAVKAAPQTVSAAKPTPATVKVNATAAAKPVVSVHAAPANVSAAQVKPAQASTQVKPVAVANKPVTAVTPAKPAVVSAKKPSAPAPATAVKAQVAPAAKTVPVKAVAVSPGPAAKAVAAKVPVHAATVSGPGSKNQKAANTVAVQETKANEKEKKETPRPTTAAGRRDPFISPVVNLSAVGSGCASGKRCLAIDQIALRGVVRSDTGMIAVVVNAMDKAYFLRENDPVFNGYVVKITGDSIVFKESFKDRLGKPLTRDVTKTISRPVA